MTESLRDLAEEMRSVSHSRLPPKCLPVNPMYVTLCTRYAVLCCVVLCCVVLCCVVLCCVMLCSIMFLKNITSRFFLCISDAIRCNCLQYFLFSYIVLYLITSYYIIKYFIIFHHNFFHVLYVLQWRVRARSEQFLPPSPRHTRCRHVRRHWRKRWVRYDYCCHCCFMIIAVIAVLLI